MIKNQKVHLIGICGSGMGGAGILFKELGFYVQGSDLNCAPPMNELLNSANIPLMKGWNADNISKDIDFIIVGNVCRKDNIEVTKAIDLNIPYYSMPAALTEHVLSNRFSIVIAGTHGKSTTTALTSYLIKNLNIDAGFLIGGVSDDFSTSTAIGTDKPFVIEGDEYDSAFFDKVPKIWRYKVNAAILTSAEHDHADIYPEPQKYFNAFEKWAEEIIPDDGVLIAWGGDEKLITITDKFKGNKSFYGLDIDKDRSINIDYWIKPYGINESDYEVFEFYFKDKSIFKGEYSLKGYHNLRNLCGSLALLHKLGYLNENNIEKIKEPLKKFKGVKRRQEKLIDNEFISIYWDFAHHPTAVRETISSFRRSFPARRLWTIFEPRSATSCRNVHQKQYSDAFNEADIVIIAPVARAEIKEDSKLNTNELAKIIKEKNKTAFSPAKVEDILEIVLNNYKKGDLILFMSNGTFNNIPMKLVSAIQEKIIGNKW